MLLLRFPNGKNILLPVDMREKTFQNGIKGFYGECPSVVIPKPVPEGLPWKKQMDMEFERSITVRFILRRGYRQDENGGKLQISLIPLKNPAGQTGIVLREFAMG